MRVTFDTNVLDRVTRPALCVGQPHQTECLKIHAALVAGHLHGFFCETVVTLEGIQKVHRAEVFGSTKLRQHRREIAGEKANETIVQLTFAAEQPKRQPLHPKTLERISAALNIGMRALRAPRIGGIRIEDPDGKVYALDPPTEAELGERLDRYMEVARQIEARGAGFARVEKLAARFALRANIAEPWFRSLDRAVNDAENIEVHKAIAEWSDGDSVAAHIGYANDYFCTLDEGKSAGASSVFDSANRSWLQSTYGIEIVSPADLAAKL